MVDLCGLMFIAIFGGIALTMWLKYYTDRCRDEDCIKLLYGSGIILVGFVLGIGLLYIFYTVDLALFGVGLLGLIILVFTLLGLNIMSKDPILEKAEVRRAIGLSLVAVFFGLLAVSDKIKIETNTLLGNILSNYWWIIMTIIGFYFGGRSAEKIVTIILEKWVEAKKEEKDKLT